MGHRIARVRKGGAAWRAGVRPGDVLLCMQGQAVADEVDYQALSARARLEIEVERAGQSCVFVCRKTEHQPLGIDFCESLLGAPRACANRCVFCFVDQLPPNLRETLYVKDDDWRHSLLMGNYVTLTNVGPREMARIVARKASPLYVSVHATNPEVRAWLLGNKNSGNILRQLEELVRGGVAFHTQAVLCPGVNDGAVLEETMRALAELHPACRSLALVPVGVTRHREGLVPLTPFDQASARRVLDICHAFQQTLLRRLGTRFVFAADELYLLAQVPLPPEQAYEGYAQIENGVGLMRQFEQEFTDALAECGVHAKPRHRDVLVATGVSAAPYLRALLEKAVPFGVRATVCAVENRFFGASVTVAGLLTGGDLREALAGMGGEVVLLPGCMLREGFQVFLDDTTLHQLEAALGVPVRAIPVDGYALAAELLELE